VTARPMRGPAPTDRGTARGYMPRAETVEWASPPELMVQLREEFGPFELDPAATPENAQAPRFYSEREDGLRQPWNARSVYVNPPYGHGLGAWVRRAVEAARAGAVVVMLLPARTDTAWFHDCVWDAQQHRPRPGVEVRLLRGRVRYGGRGSAPFPSMVVVFRPLPPGEAGPSLKPGRGGIGDSGPQE